MRDPSSGRHCMVVHAYYPLGETRVKRQADALITAGIPVEVICLRAEGEPAREVVDEVRVTRLPVRRHRSSGMAVQFLEYVTFLVTAAAVVGVRHLWRRYATVQIHSLPDFLVFAGLVPKLTGTPVILDIHDLMPEFFRARTNRPPGHPLSRLVALEERLSLAFADHVITVTEGWRQILARRGAGERSSVVMNVADSAVFSPRAGRPANGYRIVYHGTFTERYGVLLLVRAIAEVRESVDDVTLDLLGDGDARGTVTALVDELGLADVVSLSPGMLDSREVLPYLERASVGVVPNLSNVFTDGLLPTKLMEYVAVGVPVVAARTPMVASYFSDDEVAFFEPGNVGDLVATLLKLHDNPDLLDRLAEAAGRFNVEHNWRVEASAYTSTVASLARSGRV